MLQFTLLSFALILLAVGAICLATAMQTWNTERFEKEIDEINKKYELDLWV